MKLSVILFLIIFPLTNLISQPITWYPAGFESNSINSVAINKTNSLIFAGGRSNQGIFRSSNYGNNWTQLSLSGLIFLSISIAQNGKILTSPTYSSNNLFISTNYGNNWNGMNVGGTYPIYSIATYNNNVFLIASDYGIYRSGDGGSNWSQRVVTTVSDLFLTVTFNLAGVSYAGKVSGGIWRSLNEGIDWLQVYNTSSRINSITCSPLGSIFAAGEAGFGIYRSTDNGSSWQLSGLAGMTTNCIITNSIGHILAGTNGFGVFRSTDDGNTWSPINNGLTNLIVYSLATDMNDCIFSATDNGVFRTCYPTEIKNTNNFINGFFLSQNYPNPFNPTTTIKFDLTKSSVTNLVVYDALGREVAVLVNEELKAGSYQVDWDGSGYPSGVYFYQLASDEFVETKKMLMLK